MKNFLYNFNNILFTAKLHNSALFTFSHPRILIPSHILPAALTYFGMYYFPFYVPALRPPGTRSASHAPLARALLTNFDRSFYTSLSLNSMNRLSGDNINFSHISAHRRFLSTSRDYLKDSQADNNLYKIIPGKFN